MFEILIQNYANQIQESQLGNPCQCFMEFLQRDQDHSKCEAIWEESFLHPDLVFFATKESLSLCLWRDLKLLDNCLIRIGSCNGFRGWSFVQFVITLFQLKTMSAMQPRPYNWQDGSSLALAQYNQQKMKPNLGSTPLSSDDDDIFLDPCISLAKRQWFSSDYKILVEPPSMGRAISSREFQALQHVEVMFGDPPIIGWLISQIGKRGKSKCATKFSKNVAMRRNTRYATMTPTGRK